MWLQVDQSLPDHRKTSAVADRLHIPEVHVVGHMVTLWLWCMDNAKSGRLAGISPRTIAQKAQWSGDPDQFVNALIAAGFLDDDFDGLAIHNWEKYTGKILDQRKAHARRQADYERRKLDEQLSLMPESDPAPCPLPDGQVTDTCPSTGHDMTQDNMTGHERSSGGSPPESGPKPLREDQQIWACLQKGLGIPRGTKFPDQTRFAWNKAIKEFRGIGVKPDQIEPLCNAYEALFGKRPPTPHALLVHYPECQAYIVAPPRLNGATRGAYNNVRGPNGTTAANHRPDGRKTESLYFGPDDSTCKPGGTAVPDTAPATGLRGLGDLDGIPRSG